MSERDAGQRVYGSDGRPIARLPIANDTKVGRAVFAPDYKSIMAGGCVKELPGMPYTDLDWGTGPSDPREAAILGVAQMLRELRPGQTLNVYVNPKYDGQLGSEPYLIVSVTDVIDGKPE